MSETTFSAWLKDLITTRGKTYKIIWSSTLIALGPAFHIGYLTYILGEDVILTATYADLSIALPLSFLMVLVAMLAIPVINVKRRSARIAILIWAGFYFYATLTMPWQSASIFRYTRLLTMSPWLVLPQTSMIWTVMAYMGLACYGLSVACVLFFELKKGFNPFRKEHVVQFKRGQRVRFKATIGFLAVLIPGMLMLTGNQYWYQQAFTLHYTANSTSVEYWIGVQEQFYNGIFNIASSTSIPIVTHANVMVDLSPLQAGSDPFYAYRFQTDVSPGAIDQAKFLNSGKDSNLNDVYYEYSTWYYLAPNFTRLYLVDVTPSLATRLESARNGTNPLNMTCTGYYQSRLEVLKATKACIVRGIPRNNSKDANFNATMWLYYRWGIHVQTPAGNCGNGFLMNYTQISQELLDYQATRAEGPYYYRAVIEGAMFDNEHIDNSTGDNIGKLIDSFTIPTYGIAYKGGKDQFVNWAWGLNTMSEAQYYALDDQWNALLDLLHAGETRTNSTPDPSLQFNVVNCGIPENLLDYSDGDPDYARFNHNLGYGTHFAVDGYMFYRGADEPYWVYGFCVALAQKPKVVPYEQRLVLLGCVNSNPYNVNYTLDPGSRFRFANGTWTRDVNNDGRANGFDALMLDIMMCGATGIPRVNLWPGGGPRSTCCDYEEIPTVDEGRDFFTDMARALNQSMDIQFSFLPSHEHYWDKILVDIPMDLMAPKGLWVVVFFVLMYLLFAFLMTNNLFRIERKSRNQ